MNPYPRILLLGAAGQVGRELLRSFSDYGEVLAQDHRTVDLAIPEQVRSFIRNAGPDIILNAAAYTAVDRAESEPELARSVNGRAPGVLAEEALRAGALLVHYSTDYVFDGSKANPWSESDAPNPLNMYGASKLEGEEAVQRVGGKYLIFRTSWVYGPHGNNFLRTMLRLGRERDQLNIVDDQYGAPTTSIELARATRAIVGAIMPNPDDTGWEGLYHMTCSGSVSWYGFAQAIFACAAVQLDQKTPTLKAISAGEFNAKARRPSNSVLSNEKLFARFGIHLAGWENALNEVMARLKSDVPQQSP